MSNRDETQSKAFLRWANIVLSKHSSGQIPPVDNLVSAVQDGVILGRIAEVVIPTTLKISQPKNDLQRVQTITLALDAFENGGCKLVNIHSSALARGDIKATLGLMFQLCIRYQVQSKDSSSTSVAELKQQLLAWINAILSTLKPEDNLAIRAFTDNYNEKPLICNNLEKDLIDGTILIGLIAALSLPYASKILAQMHDQFDKAQADICLTPEAQKKITSLQATCILTNSIAMSTASNLFEIPLLVDPEDIVLNCDGNANLAYLSYFKNLLLNVESLDFNSYATNIHSSHSGHLLDNDFIPTLPPTALTISTFDPTKDYDDDVIFYL